MNDIYEILPTVGTNFWLYCLTKNNFNNLKNYKGMYISCFLHYEVKKGDIIFIYSKEVLKNGFAGICRASKNLKLNDNNNKIFNDKNMNNYIIKLNYITLFENIVKINDIINYIKFDKPGFRSTQSFTSKFVKKSVSLIKIDYQGETILKKLFELTTEEDEETNIFLKKKKIKIIDKKNNSNNSTLSGSLITTKSSTDSTIKTSTKSTSMDSTIKTSNSNKIKTSNSSKIKTNDIIDDITVTGSFKELEESSENDDGFIPILLIPCNDFKWDKMSEKYFKKHYKLCKNCEKTNNNNNIDIGYFLDDAEIEIIDVTGEKNIDLTLTMNAYDSLSNYSPEESNETESIEETINSSEELSEYTEESDDNQPFIQIIKVDNNHYLYDKCLFISWKY